ncbi:MAG: hypothetical protein ABEJ64_01670 [Candidatus Nanohaloarchaea archaeon]
MPATCDECGRDLHVNPVEKPNTDWVKVVCSRCGAIKNISMVRLSVDARKRE